MIKNSTCLGVDTSGKDIKIVELRKVRGQYEVVQAARLNVGQSDAVTTLRHFLIETDTEPSVVVGSLPANACSVKFAQLPKTKAAETARMARYEAETQIPLPLTDLVWGYTAEKVSKDEALQPIILAGVRRTIVDSTVAVLEGSRLPLSTLMVSSLAEVRSLSPYGTSDEPLFILDVGDEWTELVTVTDGMVTACRSVPQGLAHLADAVAADRGVNLSDAWDMIRQGMAFRDCVNFEDLTEQSAVREWIEGMTLEIRRTALASISTAESKPLNKALLVGDGAAIDSLDQLLSAGTGMAVEIGDPWSNMTLSTVVAHNTADTPSVFSVATGLAMAGFDRGSVLNLMPEQHAEERIRRQKDIRMLSALGAGLLVLIVAFFLGTSTVNSRTAELDDIRFQVDQVKKTSVKIAPGLSSTTSTLSDMLAGLKSDGNSPIEILKQVSMSVPKSCWLTEFRFESGKSVVLRGSALSNSAVADSIYKLSKTNLFDSVSLDYSNLGKRAKDPSYEFQIKCALPPNTALDPGSKNGNSKSKRERLVVR